MDGATSSNRVLILAGPTASGKTELAVALAQRVGAEIVGADSRQIYRDMPIGTAAPTPAQLACVPHHLVNFVDPHARYSAARYVHDARVAIAQIQARGRRVIVVGGTGFYIRALCGDVALAPAYDPAIRDRLAREARVHPPEVLHAWLAARDPRRASQVAATDAYRITRALEISLACTTSEDGPPHPSAPSDGLVGLKVWLEIDQVELERRIEQRVDAMLASGFLEEAERIGPDALAANAVGYHHALAYLRGWSSAQELRTLLARATRRYAKRQRTWFRTEPRMVNFEVKGGVGELERLAREHLGWA